MNPKSPLAPVEHMLDCAKLAISYVEGLEKGDFMRIGALSRPLS